MLLSAQIPTPTRIYVHGFITVDGKKMSKTIGNVVDPFTVVEKYGCDTVRFYLLREIPALDDGDFSYNRLDEVYAADLANELGNLIMRITTLAEKDGIEINHPVPETPESFDRLYQEFQFHKVIETIWGEIKNFNRQIDEFAPWKKTAPERKDFLQQKLEELHTVGYLLQPIMPQTAAKIMAATQGTIKKIAPLFPRLVQ